MDFHQLPPYVSSPVGVHMFPEFTLDVRRKKSGPALRAFLSVATLWRLTAKQQQGLLGWPALPTYHQWKKGNHDGLPYDTLIRISLLLGIYKTLHILYPDDAFADRWVGLSNTNSLLRNKAPLEMMMESDFNWLCGVRRLLDSRVIGIKG